MAGKFSEDKRLIRFQIENYHGPTPLGELVKREWDRENVGDMSARSHRIMGIPHPERVMIARRSKGQGRWD